MRHCLPILIFWPIAVVPLWANGEADDRSGLIGSHAPAGKLYVCKHSAGEPREMEFFFLPPAQAHGFFTKDLRPTMTLIAADGFLTRIGLLNGEPTLKSKPLIQ